jgi:p-cumate 2,3-dioxygenase ferredoxin subunit
LEKIRLCALIDVNPGVNGKFEIPGRDAVALYWVDGKYYATDDMCTHAAASLSEEGDLDEFAIECTWHGGKFDIRSGDVLTPPCTQKLKTYPVIIEDAAVFVMFVDHV